MNAAHLSDGELEYEMHVRSMVNKETVEDNRRSLRRRLRDEAKGSANPPRTVTRLVRNMRNVSININI